MSTGGTQLTPVTGGTVSVSAILGHPDANSYLSLADANTLAAQRMDSGGWDAQSDDTKGKLLIQASFQIDTLPMPGRPIWPIDPWKQKLRFPVWKTEAAGFWLLANGTADSGSVTTLVDDDLADEDLYRDDLFNGGALCIDDGTGKFQHMTVTDFDVSTGTVTFATQDTAIDSTSEYTLIGPLPEDFKRAVLEQAIHLAAGGTLGRPQMIADGIQSMNTGRSSISINGFYPNLISVAALELLRSYLSSTPQM